ncbi:MAG TPA: TetR family transcriptional regulator [Thermoleophilaceae bacterium]|nr:TetR family transcriptional regulator [Thermoleophilaceae bacterium]
MAIDEVGLRERKKERTRQTLAEAAAELFDLQGFQDTTIRQIADAAEVSPRTVSAYFPVKEELVFCDHREMFDQLEQRLEERPDGATTADTLRAWLMELLESVDVDLEQSRRTRELIESDPALRIYERGLQERAEQMVAKAVAVDLGVSADELVPHMVGAATIAALDAMGRRAKDPGAADFQATALTVVDDAMAFIGGGVQALADR